MKRKKWKPQMVCFKTNLICLLLLGTKTLSVFNLLFIAYVVLFISINFFNLKPVQRHTMHQAYVTNFCDDISIRSWKQPQQFNCSSNWTDIGPCYLKRREFRTYLVEVIMLYLILRSVMHMHSKIYSIAIFNEPTLLFSILISSAERILKKISKHLIKQNSTYNFKRIIRAEKWLQDSSQFFHCYLFLIKNLSMNLK